MQSIGYESQVTGTEFHYSGFLFINGKKGEKLEELSLI